MALMARIVWSGSGASDGEQVAEELDELWVELRTGMAAQLPDRRLVRHGALVRTVVDHGVIGVGDGHDPRAQRDLVGSQAERVAVTGVALVVVQDDRDGILERGSLLEDDLADARVLDHRPPFRRGQRRWLVEDLLRDGDLADVVESAATRSRSISASGRCSCLAIETTIVAMTGDGWPR